VGTIWCVTVTLFYDLLVTSLVPPNSGLFVYKMQLESVEDKMQHQLTEQDKQWRKKLDHVEKQHKNRILKVHIDSATSLRTV